jgi:hypothetical protein
MKPSPYALTASEICKYRQEQVARNGLIEARMARIESRRFLDTPELPTDFGTADFCRDPHRTDDALAEAMEVSK